MPLVADLVAQLPKKKVAFVEIPREKEPTCARPTDELFEKTLSEHKLIWSKLNPEEKIKNMREALKGIALMGQKRAIAPTNPIYQYQHSTADERDAQIAYFEAYPPSESDADFESGCSK
jgi:hypothetical protein